MITYIGNGIWTDSTGRKWKNGTSEEFETDTNSTDFLSDRKDFEYMVQYGAMRINSMSIDVSAPPSQSENQEDIEKTPGEASETAQADTEEDKPKAEIKKIVTINAK